jgi:hypothetical protein
MSDPSGNITESAGDVADRLVGEIEDILGYIFYKKSPNDENENNVHDENDENENNDDSDSNSDNDNEASISSVDSQRHFTSKLYRCSQDKATANYSNYQSAAPKRLQRRRVVQERYACSGRIRIFISKESRGAKIHIPSLEPINLQQDQLLLRFFHKCIHPPRSRKPVPISVRNFIKDPINNSRSPSEMIGRLIDAVKAGVLQNVDMVDITDSNVRYWWLQTTKEQYQRDNDPWISAVTFVREQPNVVVYSYIHERRRYFCWFVDKQFDVDLPNITEVYIDSTHNTNGQNAELFAIIGCEKGYGVPIGYMLMEKKPTDDSKIFPGEVIAACTQFFNHAKEQGLKPLLVRSDKCAAEIAAIKVLRLFSLFFIFR